MLVQSVPQEFVRKHFPEAITPPRLIVQQADFVAILDAVRNTVLDWTLKLESDGVLGEGMTFSSQEKKTVMKNVTNYNIGNFNGVLGNVSGSNVQIGNFNDIEEQLKKAKIPEPEREELRGLMEGLSEAKGKSKDGIIKRGLAWVIRNGQNLGSLSDGLRGWFEQG